MNQLNKVCIEKTLNFDLRVFIFELFICPLEFLHVRGKEVVLVSFREMRKGKLKNFGVKIVMQRFFFEIGALEKNTHKIFN
jgi:hypothetical protein